MVQKLQAQLSGIRNEIIRGNLTGVLTRFSDLLLVSCVALMVGMMIVPLPTFLLDIFLTINITIAVVVLMVSIYISTGTQIASFPTLLLITTLYRLSLDISATRLILLNADAGEVIRAFGMFVVGGNFVVGAVIFLIITLVQFIVITKGSERVAEVSARFTLDAMPGKQMSIDADLRAGTIDFQEARRRREALSRESQFYGAMDGAMKFVKGDAMASIIITVINIVGGLVIGVAMNGMPVMEAVQTYSILTIGNGLVSQIPALLISISAGMVVTRVASDAPDSNLGKDIAAQVLAQPKAIAVASGILFVMMIIPGLPKIPFALLAALTGAVAFGLFRAMRMKAEAAMSGEVQVAERAADPEITLTVPLVIEVSQQLTPYIDTQTEAGKKFYELLVQVRNSLYYQLGVIFPPIRVNGNMPYERGTYMFWINEVPLLNGQVKLDCVLVNEAQRNLTLYGLEGAAATNPATGKPAAWIGRDQRAAAEAAGLQVWDVPEIVILHLTAFLRNHAREFIGLQEVQWMLNTIKQYYPTLVDEAIPKPVSLQQFADILQRLVEEEVSIRDLKTILQAIADAARTDRDTFSLTERVRVALRRKICYQLSDGKPMLFVYRLDPEVEDMFRNSVRQSSTGPYMSMDPSDIDRVVAAAKALFGNLPASAQRPVLLVDTDIRRFVKRLLDYSFPDVSVISYQELTPEIRVQPLGNLALVKPQIAQSTALQK